MSAVLQFDEVEHRYTVAGRTVPSVTQILGPIRPDFSQIPPLVLERKRLLGQAVHLACELDDLGELDEETLDDELAPFLSAWRKFKAENKVRIVMNEQRLYHPTLGYAGTIDRMAWLEVVGPENWALDIKTSLAGDPSYGVQLAGYQGLLEAQGEPIADQRRGSIHLYPDATYKLVEYRNPNDAACFRALLSVHQWKQNAK
jgi:hypothetical protein